MLSDAAGAQASRLAAGAGVPDPSLTSKQLEVPRLLRNEVELVWETLNHLTPVAAGLNSVVVKVVYACCVRICLFNKLYF